MANRDSLPPAGPLIDRYMRDIDRTLLRRNLALTPQQRLLQLQELARFAEELHRAGRAISSGRK